MFFIFSRKVKSLFSILKHLALFEMFLICWGFGQKTKVSAKVFKVTTVHKIPKNGPKQQKKKSKS